MLDIGLSVRGGDDFDHQTPIELDASIVVFVT
jgi:hypothetical protein